MTQEQMDHESSLTLDELLDRAREHGAKVVSTDPVGFVAGMDGLYQAKATIVTADGRSYTRSGYAREGDCQGEATEDTFPLPARAETRALRAALKAAYGAGAVAAQEGHVKLAQMAVRETASALGVTVERLKARLHKRYKIHSTNDLNPDQAHDCMAWCQALREGKQLIEEVTADEDAA